MEYDVYGIGNPLIDINAESLDAELEGLSLLKGTMNLIELDKKKQILCTLEGRRMICYPAGDCPNTMMGVARLGGKAALSGAIGDDEQGREYLKLLKETGVSPLLKIKDGFTGSSNIFVTSDRQRTMATFLGNCRLYCKEDIDIESLRSSRFFYVTGYMWDTEAQKEATLLAMKLARSYGVKTIFNLADPSLVGRNKDIFPRIIGEFVDILICNEDEGRALTSQDEPGSQLSSLASLVFVTRGENGSEVWQGGKCAHIRPYAVSAVDTTGAGDMYAAGVIYGLSQGFSYADSAVIGSFYASRVVQKQGAYVTPEIAEEVKSFISSM